MIKVFYLLWTFLAAVLVTSLSYFYIKGNLTHGFPFAFAKDTLVNKNFNDLVMTTPDTTIIKGVINGWVFALDVFFWWILFSILLVMVKNYVLES